MKMKGVQEKEEKSSRFLFFFKETKDLKILCKTMKVKHKELHKV